MQILLKSIALTVSVPAIGFVSAMPASAAASPSTVYISGCGASGATLQATTASGGGTAVTSIAWTSASDTLTFVNNCASSSVTLKGYVGGTNSLQWQKVAPNPNDSIVSNALGTTFTSFRFVDSQNNVITITAAGPGGGTNGGTTTGSGYETSQPEPVLQQFGRPASGTCDSGAAADLNWSGVGSGGWSESWAEWVNEGRGGSVCSRMLVYSSALGAWTVS